VKEFAIKQVSDEVKQAPETSISESKLNKKNMFIHKYNPDITFEYTGDTNNGVKGIQRNPKSLSKKERTTGINVNYSDSEFKELFSKIESNIAPAETPISESKLNKNDSLRHFIESQVSSGMLSSGTDFSIYTDIDGLRSKILELIREKEGKNEYSIPYSVETYNDYKNRAYEFLINQPKQEPEIDEESINTINMENESPETMKDIKNTTSTPSVSRWDQVPVRWRNVNAVRPIVFSLNPYDKKFNSLIKDFVGDDELRPVMTSINFGENGIVCTDALKLLHFPNDKSEFSGNYASPTSLAAFKLEKEKVTTLDQATKKLNELKYPNWQAVVPKDNPYTYEIDTMKFYQYVSAAMNYTNKVTKQILFKYDKDKNIGFNGEFLLQSLEALMKIQSCPKIYIHMSEPSRAAILSYDKVFSPTQSTYVLIMPVMLNFSYSSSHSKIVQTYGAFDIDYGKSLGCYFDFSTNEIHNADGSVSDYRENYGDAPGLPLTYIAMFNSFLKSSELAKQSDVFNTVRISSDGILVSDTTTRIEMPNDFDLESGLYDIENNVLIKNMRYDLDDYSLTKRVSTKDPILVAKKDAFIFYVNKLSNHLGSDDLRPVMQGILLEKTSDVTHAVGTDAHTIIHLNISGSLSFSKPTFNFLILNIKQLLNVSKSMDSNDIALYIDPELERYRIVADRLHFEGELLTRGMVNWKGVIPNLVKQKLEFNIKNLFECISNPDIKKYADSQYTKPKDLIVFNNYDELYAIHNPKSNQESVKLCDMKIKHSDIDQMYNINQNFVGIMPNAYSAGNYINFGIGKLQDVIDSIGKEDCEVYYNNLTQVYLFQSENLNYKTSDVYKPEKPKKVAKPIIKPSETPDEKQEIKDALTGAKTLLKYVKGKEKTNISAYIRGLEILMK
jgi:hypothetical protein